MKEKLYLDRLCDKSELVLGRVRYVSAVCVGCRKATIWDYQLGPEPLCRACWDKFVITGVSPYLKRRAKRAKASRAYYLLHWKEVADWYIRNRERVRVQQSLYYRLNREAVLNRQRGFNENNRDKVLAKYKRYDETHKCERAEQYRKRCKKAELAGQGL